MQLTSNGITITIPDGEVIAMALRRLNGEAAAATTTTTPAAPRIGSPWPGQGGIYAGVVRGDEGKPDYHLDRRRAHRDPRGRQPAPAADR